MERPLIKTLLVTVGSTLFPDLTNLIISPQVLDLLEKTSIQRLVIQYGRTDIESTSGVEPNATGEAKFNWKGLDVEMMRFTDAFQALVKQVDAVISHAGKLSSIQLRRESEIPFKGSGSILTVLRASKPLLVVPNTSLMDNHQAELADALGKDGYLTVSSVK